MANIIEAFKTGGKIIVTGAQKYSPEIFFGLGVIGLGATVYLTKRATEKNIRIKEDMEDQIRDIKFAKNVTEEEKAETIKYIEKRGKKQQLLNMATVFTSMIGTAASFGLSFGILKGREGRALAVAASLKQGWDCYRGRIKGKYGEEADTYGMYGVETEEVTVKNGDTGEKEKIKRIVKKEDGDLANPFAVMFAQFDYEHRSGSKYWVDDPVYNESMLSTIEGGFIRRYEAGEPLFLSDVYKALGFDYEDLLLTKGDAIQKMGWWKDHEPEGADGYFSLRMTRVINKPDPGYGPEVENVVWIIDPNVPGCIV